MSEQAIRDLQRRVAQLERAATHFRRGVITSGGVSGIADVSMGGSVESFESLRSVSSVPIKTGDEVVLLVGGNDAVILGRIGENVPYADVFKNVGSQNIPHNQNTLVQFDSGSAESDGITPLYGQHLLEVQYEGRYLFWGNVVWDGDPGAGGHRELMIWSPTTAQFSAHVRWRPGGTGTLQQQIIGVDRFAPGTQVGLFANQTSGAGLSILLADGNYRFAMQWVGST